MSGGEGRTDGEVQSLWRYVPCSRIRAQEAAQVTERETFEQVKHASLLLATSLDCTGFDKAWEVREEVASSI